jgi:hypothetical protein
MTLSSKSLAPERGGCCFDEFRGATGTAGRGRVTIGAVHIGSIGAGVKALISQRYDGIWKDISGAWPPVA